MGKKDTKEFIGTIELGEVIRVSDPCYDMDVWCAGTIENVLPGKYNCYFTITDDRDWGKHVSELEVVHETEKECKEFTLADFEVGVDSGTCGIYDIDYFSENRDDADWYTRVTDPTIDGFGDVHDGKCVVCSSGYGDGGYDCCVGRSNGKAVAFKVRFI